MRTVSPDFACVIGLSPEELRTILERICRFFNPFGVGAHLTVNHV
jgi:hypothetical protein